MLIGVDTNVLLDQAVKDADVIDALSVIRERRPAARFLVTPTVLGELGETGGKRQRRGAQSSRRCNRFAAGLGIRTDQSDPCWSRIVEQIALQLRIQGIIPDEEENDALIAAEAALLGCSILLSSDHHLLEANEHPRFHAVLQSHPVEGDHLIIAKPKTIVAKFYRRR